MKRKAEAELAASRAEVDDDAAAAAAAGEDAPQRVLPKWDESGDVCEALMLRYGKSAAPQHRHLCAAAAAMRAILQEETLPLTVPAYFAAAITALRSAARSDPDSATSLTAFLSILLPLVPSSSLPPAKAKDAAFVLVGLLRDPPAGGLPTGTVRSVVKSLGCLVLRLDSGDWEAVQLPLETLLAFSTDGRYKVRRCAQSSVEKVFSYLKDSSTINSASMVVFQMFEKHIPFAKRLVCVELAKIPESKELLYPGSTEVLHMLNIVKLVSSNLSRKVRVEIYSNAFKLLGPHFNVLTRHILKVVEALLEHLEAKHLKSQQFVSCLLCYISSNERKPMDTISSTLELLKNCLKKLETRQPALWTQTLPLIFEAVSGYSCSDINSFKDVAHLLEEMISVHVDRITFMTAEYQTGNCIGQNTAEAVAVKSICSSLEKMLSCCPSEDLLTVISVLFLRLGEFSNFFMKEILLKLSHWATITDKKKPIMKHIQECIGSAVIAMGSDKILSLIPITLQENMLTCSNTWLITILDRYTVGASLHFFMQHIVPLAKSLKSVSNEVKKESKQKALQSWAYSLWNLLVAFCRYPSDTSESFGSFAKLLLAILKEDPALHEIVAKALQEFVNGNQKVICANQDKNMPVNLLIGISSEILEADYGSLSYFSKNSAHKNLKVLSTHCMDFVQSLADVFFDASPEKRAYLKETLRCLSSLTGSANIHSFFLSLLKRFDLENSLIESEKSEDQMGIKEGEEALQTDKQKARRCLLLELICAFVEAADKDLITVFFEFIMSSLLNGTASCHVEAFSALSIILKEHSCFCLARVDEIMMLLHNIKSPLDGNILKNRLSCYQHVLIHMIEVNEENMDKKAFLILNEIILTLKSKKESRKLAYDVILATSSSLKNSSSENSKMGLQRLLTMVMGYLSGPSPHITSGAISALSLLIYRDADFCLAVPNLVPSVLLLLQNKANEVIKAALGFVKVLVSSLQSDKLMKLQADIVNGILPWSSVSKHHFRSKVGVILEILIRKCGFDMVDMIVPEKYQGFVKTITQGRQSRKNPKELADSKKDLAAPDYTTKRARKSDSNDATVLGKKHFVTSNSHKGTRMKHKTSISIRKETEKMSDRSVGRTSKSNSKFSNPTQSRIKKRRRMSGVTEKQKRRHQKK